MFSTIVVGQDGSEGSGPALGVAEELAQREGARLVLAHVVQEIIGKGGGPLLATEDEIEAELRRLAQQLTARGVDTTLEIRRTVLGGPAAVLEAIAADAGADLIVVGTHGHAPVTELLVGSVTHRLLHVAKRPVLVVPKGR
jgi:nucleotide-binding universal stress UspA family protein